MRPGVVDLRRETFAIAHGERSLQRVVIRDGAGLEMIDVEECSAGRREWPIVKGPLGRDTRVQRLVDIAITKQFFAGRADVANFEYAISEQLVLNIQVVVLDVRRAQVRIDCEYI